MNNNVKIIKGTEHTEEFVGKELRFEEVALTELPYAPANRAANKQVKADQKVFDEWLPEHDKEVAREIMKEIGSHLNPDTCSKSFWEWWNEYKQKYQEVG